MRLTRRAALLLAAGSVTAACGAAGPDDVPPMPEPIRESPATDLEVKPVSHWAAVFAKSWDFQYASSLPQSQSKDSWDHYNLSYSLDALVAMFRATRERRYLDRALEFAENVMAAAAPSQSIPDSRFKDAYLGWPSSMNGEDGDEIPLYESYFWRYATGMLVAMRESAMVMNDRGYRARYDRLLAFAAGNVFAKWHDRGADDYIYRERTHMAAHWALIALHLDVLAPDARYHAVRAEIDRRLRDQMRRSPVEPTAYFWSDVWGSAKRPGQDVGHGNGVMAYVIEARDRGSAWTDADIAAFSAVLPVIWPGGNDYRAYVDGTGTDNGWLADGFVKLGRSRAAVQRRLEAHQVVNDQFAANMALNARVLTPKGMTR
ncbi:hypothetical protein [Paractinoplanes atraurantiacus]|uniref:Glycosyl hydrolase family 76 n=1 Tax=Paractinoplanes atraurantiacus TaxID=1036182 RepID=A0A285J892_9ACTN|nr:hypothetical protein [Actinoplanes atraurantiacus]SNY56539.1 hypothetical protein SAMN05421748_117184 [Actinoplanes atraurantiacus]